MFESVSSVTSDIKCAIDNKTPFSLLRIGDGEGDVILKNKNCGKRLTGWTGVKFDNTEAHALADGIIQACINADIVGVPCPTMMRNQPNYAGSWQRAQDAVVKNGYYTGKLTSAYIHYDIDYSLLEGQDVMFISCHDLSRKIKEYGSNSVEGFIIDSDYKRMKAAQKSKATKQHYPKQYNQINKWLDKCNGKVVLVAAGGLGKIYCNWVKQKGGIAIDIGSVADSWMSVGSRSFFKKVNPANLGGWAIEKPLYDYIRAHFPSGSHIIEFGSGTGTIELAKHYNVWSIEHNEQYLGLAPSNYIYAPLKYKWYDVDALKQRLPQTQDLLLIDGPPANLGDRRKFLEYMELFSSTATIICDDINRKKDKELFDQLCEITGRTPQILNFNKTVGVLMGDKPKQRALLPVPPTNKSTPVGEKGIVVQVNTPEQAKAAQYLAKSIKTNTDLQVAIFHTKDALSQLDTRTGNFFDHIIEGQVEDDFYADSTVKLSPETILYKHGKGLNIFRGKPKLTKHQVRMKYDGVECTSRGYIMTIYRDALIDWMA